jgi:hypothetical protein
MKLSILACSACSAPVLGYSSGGAAIDLDLVYFLLVLELIALGSRWESLLIII